MSSKGVLAAVTVGLVMYATQLFAASLSYPSSASRQNYLKDASQQVLALVQANDAATLADVVHYPVTIGGSEPAVTVHNAKEFVEYYPHLFTDNLRQQVIASAHSPSINWRGARIGDGAFWLSGLCDDDQCQQVTVAITSFYNPEFYQQPFGHEAQQQLQQRMSANLPAELLPIKLNNLLWQTKDYRVRVDTLADGELRYAVWPVNADMNRQPDLVLHHGKLKYDGNGGNHYYLFSNGKYRYRLDVVVIGTDNSPAGYLTVSRGERKLVNQPVVNELTVR